MVSKAKLAVIKRKTRQRLVFTGITMGLYFTYVLSYTHAGAFLSDTLGHSHVSGALALYTGLIVVFILLELLFLFINRDKQGEGEQ